MSRRGFSIIELLVALGVLGGLFILLAHWVVPFVQQGELNRARRFALNALVSMEPMFSSMHPDDMERFVVLKDPLYLYYKPVEDGMQELVWNFDPGNDFGEDAHYEGIVLRVDAVESLSWDIPGAFAFEMSRVNPDNLRVSGLPILGPVGSIWSQEAAL